MKSLLVVAAVIAVAVAGPVQRGVVVPVAAGPEPIFMPAPIAPVGAGPAPAPAPGVHPIIIGPAIVENPMDNIVIGPAIIENPMDNISIGPAIIDFPLPEEALAPSPVAAGSRAPLVQIIVNVNGQALETPASPSPVITEADEPWPIQIVDSAPEPVQVVEVAPIVVDPVQVVEVAPIVVDPVQVVDFAPTPVEPVIIGTPVIAAPAVTLPEELN